MIKAFSFAILITAALFGVPSTAAQPTAAELVRQVVDHFRGLTSYGEMSMTIHRPDWERRMTMRAWTEGDDNTLVQVIEPKKDVGTGTLTLDGNMWTYSPKINRVIKVPSSMMSQNWMGSDFSNKDISKNADIVDQYDHTLIDQREEGGHQIYTIQSVPHEDAAIVWGKEVLVIRDDWVLLEQQFWDQDGVLLKTMKASDIKMMSGRPVASKLRMSKIEAPGEWTELQTLSVEFDVEMPKNQFTLSNLRNPPPVNVTAVLAWRNLWRHKRRTWLTVGAMIFCNTLLVFMISLQLGSYQMMIDNTLGAFSGHIQIQHSSYNDEQKIHQSVPNVVQLAQQVRTQLGLEAVAARGMAFALASSEERSFGIQIVGVQPEFEARVSTFPGLISEGRYLKDPTAPEVVIGAILAQNLKVRVGDELMFIGSGLDGSFAAGVATVVGIIDTGFAEVDRAVAEVPLGWFQEVFSMGQAGHSVVLRLPHLDDVDPTVAQLNKWLSSDTEIDSKNLAVLDWNTLEPGLKQAIKSDMTSAWFMYGVLILLVAFSVLNTQLMSVLERTREFGVMLALGTRPGLLARLVGLETFVMSTLGLGIGVLLGGLLSFYLSHAGFHYPGMEEMAAKFNLPDRMYPQVSLLSLLWGPATVFVGAMLAAIYPATRLFSLRPVAAMRAV